MRILTISLLAILFSACGGDGDGRNKLSPKPPKADPPAEEEEDFGLRTIVGLATLDYEFPFLTSCLQRTEGPELFILASSWQPDGKLDEWAEATAMTDPSDDQGQTGDIDRVLVGVNDESLGVAIVFDTQTASTLTIELGGMVVRDGHLRPEILRVIRIGPDGPQELIAGQWVPVDGGDVSFVITEAVAEVQLSRRFLGVTVAHSAWWLRAATGDEGQLDSTASLFFPTLLDADVQDFAFRGCNVWTTQLQPFSMIHLQDSRSAAPGYPMNSTAERAFQLSRLAFDATHSLGDRIKMPFDAATVIATLADVGQDVKKVPGIDERADIFGPLRINVADLGPDSTAAFPQGATFSQGVRYFLEAYLFAVNPEVSPLLRLAVATALLDKAQVRFLTPNYFFDYFGNDIETFVRLDSDTVGDLRKANAGKALPQEKAKALGHIIGAYLSQDQILDAWELTSKVVGDTAFQYAFGELLGQEAVDAEWWRGWLDKSDYVEGFAPSDLLDTDADGVPNLYERLGNSDPLFADTDGDGWTDYSERLAGTDPRNKGDRLSVIVPDGSFDDWFTLFPQRIQVDEGRSTACPTGADITHYGALATRDHLIIAAHAKDYDATDGHSGWQALINIPDEKKMVRAVVQGGSRVLELREPGSDELIVRIQRAMPMGNDTVEWVIDRRQAGFKTYFNELEAVRLQIVTVYEDEQEGTQFCDQTPWFMPYVYHADLR